LFLKITIFTLLLKTKIFKQCRSNKNI
jgi:hypothetical protein